MPRAAKQRNFGNALPKPVFIRMVGTQKYVRCVGGRKADNAPLCWTSEFTHLGRTGLRKENVLSFYILFASPLTSTVGRNLVNV